MWLVMSLVPRVVACYQAPIMDVSSRQHHDVAVGMQQSFLFNCTCRLLDVKPKLQSSWFMTHAPTGGSYRSVVCFPLATHTETTAWQSLRPSSSKQDHAKSRDNFVVFTPELSLVLPPAASPK